MRGLAAKVFVFSIIAGATAQLGFCAPASHSGGPWGGFDALQAVDEPLVHRAEDVFERLKAVADKSAKRYPKLLVLDRPGAPWAAALPDGTVLVTRGCLQICYDGRSPKIGDSRLAFVFGHEMAHLAKDDFWHRGAFDAVENFGETERKANLMLQMVRSGDVGLGATSPALAQAREYRADASGLIFMTMAGFDPSAVLSPDGDSFIREWVTLTAQDSRTTTGSHPNPQDRAALMRAQLEAVLLDLDYFHFGVRMYELGQYEESIGFFDAFRRKYPGREVLNNLGVVHYEWAWEHLRLQKPSQAFRFLWAPRIEGASSASQLERTRKRGDSSAMRRHLEKSLESLQRAVEMDASHTKTRVNLATALLLRGDASAALAAAEAGLRQAPGSPELVQVQAVALYLFGAVHGTEMSERALALLGSLAGTPVETSASYNTSTILWESDRKVEAREVALRCLGQGLTGPFAIALRQRFGIRSSSHGSGARGDWPRPPVPLGNISEKTLERLRGLDRRQVQLGDRTCEIYRGHNLTVLAIDGFLELVETGLETPLSVSELSRRSGPPIRVIRADAGKTLLYPGFGAVVSDESVKQFFFFASM